MQAPETVAVTFATYVPGASPEGLEQHVDVESTEGGAPAFDAFVLTPAVGPRFFETIGRPIVAGRDFPGGRPDRQRANRRRQRRLRTPLERNTGQGSPIGARVRQRAGGYGRRRHSNRGTESSASRDLGLNPSGDGYEEAAYIYYAAAPATAAPLVTLIRVRGNAGGLAARLPVIAAAVNPDWPCSRPCR